ncbi:CoA-transferase [Paramixta manurensis]|uniref:Acetate CoA-transferase YdiF n=1 Tax=Paramixta manurensis TaxID=2740817 RepID=A0A6M8UIF5_9GAMM|nr:CoA-transferase [Erwiniaceae bacterium PD-1]
MFKSKVYAVDEAVSKIPPGATVLVDGSGGGVNEPGYILAALKKRFERYGSPGGLTVVHPSGMGDGQGGGIDYLANPRLVRKVIGGHWSWCRQMQDLAVTDQIEAWCLPQGVMSHLLRVIASNGPGLISRVGLGTFVDPRIDGGRINQRATGEHVRLMTLEEEEFLFFRAFPIDVAIIRGSVADEDGNMTMDEEGLNAETLSAAQAAKNSGGMVIAQVKHLAARGSLDPRRVKVPGVLVDAVVVCQEQRLSFATECDPSLTGTLRIPGGQFPLLPMSARKVIARRAAKTLQEGDIVNLGYGMPDGVASVLAEQGQGDMVTFTLEQGHIGGIPATGSDFGMVRNPQAMLDAGYQFDWYDGGGLDIAILSFAEVDQQGNVNVSKFGGRVAGIGGFVNISQGAHRVVFVGTFKAGKQRQHFSSDGIKIEAEGHARKFVNKLEQISFSAFYASKRNQPVIYITERCVFELGPEGLVLTEIAPGVDLEKDILAQMDFRPGIASTLKMMDPALFGSPVIAQSTVGACS